MGPADANRLKLNGDVTSVVLDSSAGVADRHDDHEQQQRHGQHTSHPAETKHTMMSSTHDDVTPGAVSDQPRRSKLKISLNINPRCFV